MTRKRAGQLASTSRSSRRGLLPRFWRSPLVDRRPKLRLSRLEDFEPRTMLTATITGTKVTDLTGDGFDLADPPRAGVTIELWADTGNGTFDDTTDILSQSDVTDALGGYNFDNVLPGRYFIRELTPGGTAQTFPIIPNTFYTVDVVGDFVVPVGLSAPLVVDEFDLPGLGQEDSFTINFSEPDPFLLKNTDAGVLGGERDIFVDVAGVPGPASASGTVGGGIFNFGTSNPSASVVLQYDGVDADIVGPPAALLNNQNLPDVNLTAGGNNSFRIDFNIIDGGPGNPSPPLLYDIALTDSGGNAASLLGASVASSSGFISAFAPFATFTTDPGFDFSSVTSIEVTLNPGAVADVDLEVARIVVTRVQNTDFNFANRAVTQPTGSLSGFVYSDADNDGVFDGTETGIFGVTVTLLDSGGATVQTTTTDAGGRYDFIGVVPGTYSIVEGDEAETTFGFLDGKDTVGVINALTVGVGSDDRFDQIVMPAGGVGTSYNFGEILAASLSGFVYNDLNNNGIMEVGEPGIGGVIVTLSGTDDLGAAIPAGTIATTNGSGGYTFTGLRPSDAAGYTVTETQPAGFLDGEDTAGTVNGVTVGTAGADTITGIVLFPDENGVDYNFGELLASSISGFVYEDANNDGIFDAGETPIGGVTVTLAGTDDLGVPVPAGTTAVTDGTGAYTFTGLRPGTYTVTETQPAGFLDGIDTAGSAGGDVTVNDVISAIVLAQDVNSTDNNFGEVEAATLAGSVYVDADNDGVRDGTEVGIVGVTVTLTGDDDLGTAVNLTVTTDASGNYLFSGLRPSSTAGYTVTETQPAAFLDGKDAAGTEAGTVANDVISAVTIESGDAATDYIFGELNPATLAGFVYVDADNDGVKDGTETGIVGVTVTLTGTDDLGAAVNLTDTTDASGAYSFDNLRPGTYVITETQPATFLDGKDSVGTVAATPVGTLGNDTITAIVLAQDDDGINYNFGELNPASIAGTVYVDADNDGVRDVGEVGIPGAIVTLTGINDLGNVPAGTTATTDANGDYVFNNLRPGDYTVTETQPATFLDGKDTAGTSGGSAAVNDVISGIVLDQDEDSTGNNFGELVAATLTGFVYNDLDNDGIKDAGEAGIAGVIVTLSGTNDLGVAIPAGTTATTDANGAYTFTGLRPSGTAGYTVTETQPATFLDGKDTVGTVNGTPRGSAAVNDVISGIVLNSDDDGINYNFGEITFSSLSGFVYQDADNDGIRDAGENGISGATVTLTGTNDLGTAVNLVTTTSATGAYSFTNLRPGSYVVTETQPTGFIDGKDTPGTVNGVTEGVATPPDSITSVDLAPGQSGIEYNFGELLPGSLAGFVYADVNANGVKDAVEAGIPGVTVQLTGTDDLGQAVSTTVTTAANGSYSFSNLRPSSTAGYTITETHPISFIDGTDSIGTQGGTVGNDVLSAIVLNQGVNGINNNFGELGLIGGLVSKKPYITPSPFQNMIQPTDVNLDRATTALDALIVINALNAPGGTQLPAGQSIIDFFMDVNGDTFLTPLDALMIINAINNNGGTVTPSPAGGNQALQAQNMTADEAFALAIDQALSQMADDDEDEALNPFAN